VIYAVSGILFKSRIAPGGIEFVTRKVTDGSRPHQTGAGS